MEAGQGGDRPNNTILLPWVVAAGSRGGMLTSVYGLLLLSGQCRRCRSMGVNRLQSYIRPRVWSSYSPGHHGISALGATRMQGLAGHARYRLNPSGGPTALPWNRERFALCWVVRFS
jgi:hypothetical protein